MTRYDDVQYPEKCYASSRIVDDLCDFPILCHSAEPKLIIQCTKTAMIDRQSHTKWVLEPFDEKTPVSVYLLHSHIRLKDTDQPLPDATKFIHELMLPEKTHSSSAVRQSAPSIVIHPSLFETIADPAQADTLLVARRLYARRLGYVLVALMSALLAGGLVILLGS